MFFAEERGSNTGWLVLLLPVLLLMLAFVTDISMLYIASNQLQHLADKCGEGALAASLDLAMLQERRLLRVEPGQAEGRFQQLLEANAGCQGWVFEKIRITRIEVEPEGPPRLNCRLQGDYTPVFLGFWRPRITLGVESEVVLEDIP